MAKRRLNGEGSITFHKSLGLWYGRVLDGGTQSRRVFLEGEASLEGHTGRSTDPPPDAPPR